jgi:hypothetical protein
MRVAQGTLNAVAAVSIVWSTAGKVRAAQRGTARRPLAQYRTCTQAPNVVAVAPVADGNIGLAALRLLLSSRLAWIRAALRAGARGVKIAGAGPLRSPRRPSILMQRRSADPVAMVGQAMGGIARAAVRSGSAARASLARGAKAFRCRWRLLSTPCGCLATANTRRYPRQCRPLPCPQKVPARAQPLVPPLAHAGFVRARAQPGCRTWTLWVPRRCASSACSGLRPSRRPCGCARRRAVTLSGITSRPICAERGWRRAGGAAYLPRARAGSRRGHGVAHPRAGASRGRQRRRVHSLRAASHRCVRSCVSDHVGAFARSGS